MRTLIFLLGLVATQALSAQVKVHEKTYPYTNQELDIDIELGTDLVIKAWDKEEILVKVTYEINGGEDNEALRIDIDDYTDRLSVDLDLDKRKLSDSGDCCCNGKRKRRWENGRGTCVDVKVEVMVPGSASIMVETITADVTISGIVSDIDVQTVTGKIDLSWLESAGAEIALKTTRGDLYTNMKFNTKRDKGLPSISGRNLSGTYKGGEKEVQLETVTGAIYFRKTTDN
ncbi:MAG: hypothetical protein Roseis2KO_20660 [Roseivirga sp.]